MPPEAELTGAAPSRWGVPLPDRAPGSDPAGGFLTSGLPNSAMGLRVVLVRARRVADCPNYVPVMGGGQLAAGPLPRRYAAPSPARGRGKSRHRITHLP